MGTLNFAGGASLSGSGSNLQSSSGLDFGGSWIDAPSGTIVQVVQFLDAGGYSSGSSLLATSTSSFADIMSKSITTKVANSYILVEIVCVGYNGGGILRGESKLFRNSTEIDGDRYAWYSNTSDIMLSHIIKHLDSPSSSSGTTLTYTLQGASSSGTAYLGYQDSGGGAHNSITLTEIVS